MHSPSAEDATLHNDARDANEEREAAGSQPLLSVCMIVKNEEPVLARALASAAGPGVELVVVDTGSTDGTIAVAEAAGAKVHHFAWVNDFAAARNHALSKATGTWMLVLDADEELTASAKANLERVLRSSTAGALRVPVTALDDRGAPALTMPSARFIRNGCGYAYEGRVHETINGSITRAGGVIEDNDELLVVHHGYTVAESARKDRHARNRALLEAAHRAAPEDPSYWHYLAVELRVHGDHARAAELFARVLEKAPNHELVGWSASSLASIHYAERDFGSAWAIAELGVGQVLAGIHCLVQIGELALREGDADTARWCADEIERVGGDDFTDRATSLERATELRAAAKVEKEPTARTRDHVAAARERYPRNMVLATLFVKICEALGGRGKGAIDAVKRSGNAPAVVSAAISAFFRGGAFAQCVELGRKSGVHNEAWAFALAKTGAREQARRELVAFGDGAAALSVVFGLAYDDEVAIEHGLSAASPAHREALAGVRARARVSSAHAWVLTAWIEQAAAMREDELVANLVACLPWTLAERAGYRALVTFDAGDPIAALTRALEHPQALTSQEVIGLVAHSHGDMAAAATMLTMRAEAGDAPVRVYLKAADALARLGRLDDARAILALGRESRPLSRALAGATITPPASPPQAPLRKKRALASSAR